MIEREKDTGDDCFWSGRAKTTRRYAEYARVSAALRAAGLEHLYGGTKGHGFWVPAWPDAPAEDGRNRRFFSAAECVRRLGIDG